MEMLDAGDRSIQEVAGDGIAAFQETMDGIGDITMRLIVLILLVCVLNADARVGENMLQCAQRYGSPITNIMDRTMPLLTGSGASNVTYRYQGWLIRMAFVDGYACIADYQKEYKSDQPNDIAESEFQAILRAYQPDPWSETKRTVELNPIKTLSSAMRSMGDGPSWKSQQGFIAYRRPGGRTVRIINPKAVEAFEERTKKAFEAKRSPPPQF